MAESESEPISTPSVTLEAGTYEILKARLNECARDLRDRLAKLNAARGDVFGTIETALVTTDRVSTSNSCTPRDMVSIGGGKFLFGYNVHIGLRSETVPADVFSAFEWVDREFKPLPLPFTAHADFLADFHDLYKFYRDTVFAKFRFIGPYLFFVFRCGRDVTDIKTFKWQIKDGKFEYLGNRSDHEFQFPPQHEFEWKRTHRDLHRAGMHPHISIEDRVFVETVGGDLSIKIEDNTSSGASILSEPVENADQTLDDAEIFYAVVGNLILLKIRPYQEKTWRHFVFNDKLKEVHRIDAIEQACVLLPDQQGIIFSRGTVLESGEVRTFDGNPTDMHFDRRVTAPNREDFLYVFYNRRRGDYILLPYNVITQRVENAILCQGFSLFENGEMALFRTEAEPQRHHTIQIWQTPFTSVDFQPTEAKTDSFLFKVGNGDIVRCMAECNNLLSLLAREDSYADRYVDLEKRAGDLIDAYFWLDKPDAFDLKSPLVALRAAAASTVEEFDKVLELRSHAAKEVDSIGGKAENILKTLALGELTEINAFVRTLANLRSVRGELISLKDLRYADVSRINLLESQVAEKIDSVSLACVEFLASETALTPYRERTAGLTNKIESITKATEARALETEISATGEDLEMLVEIVGNLKIEDATQTTRIVQDISGIYATLNQTLARLRQRLRELQAEEGSAQFAAQLQLITQAVANFLDRADTPAKCEEFLGRLLVQVEELETRFAEFDEFLVDLADKRTEISSAFESKKLSLLDIRNRRASSLMTVAERMLNGIAHRLATLKDTSEINGFYASDQMVDRLRDVVAQLIELDDPVKADDIQSRLKTLREDTLRQLRDRKDLFVDGGNVVAFGSHKFNVNVQPIDLTVLEHDDAMALHLSGTRFFEPIADPDIEGLRHIWPLTVPSESPKVARAEYLAFQYLTNLETNSRLMEAGSWSADQTLAAIQEFMAPRYSEGYVKGVHDADAAILFRTLLEIHVAVGSLRFHPDARVLAICAWKKAAESEDTLARQIAAFGARQKLYPSVDGEMHYLKRLEEICSRYAETSGLFAQAQSSDAAKYLLFTLSRGEDFQFSQDAYALFREFENSLHAQKAETQFAALRESLEDDFLAEFRLVRDWIEGFLATQGSADSTYRDETVLLILRGLHNPHKVLDIPLRRELSGLVSEHANFKGGKTRFDYLDFVARLNAHESKTVPEFQRFHDAKARSIADGRTRLRIAEFRPQVLTSFVRNRLVDRTFLPLIGANLAKQMGTAGENTRTDRSGLLLLISPPGYGKTTLIEYIASRLGLVLIKVNGPALGHQVTSLDPDTAPNSASRDELRKLNLAFEIGDNVMIYVDDIQHCNPEFLQKFISLCDGQRRIEGVYNGQAKTYNFRGRKVAVVMAGNPYTESGEKFRIPDMLSNRADTYNMGDMATGTHIEAFQLSYIENALTSNSVLSPIATRGRDDVYSIIKLAQTGQSDGVELEGNYSPRELDDMVGVMKKLLRIRDIILKVNAEYIRSAGQAEAFRTEPPFLLQGSYRNMNRLAEKVVPVMNDAELEELIADHYRNEAQTLTTGAEANLLKLAELLGQLSAEQSKRWDDIKRAFQRNLITGSGNTEDPAVRVIGQLAAFNVGLESIRDVIQNASTALAQSPQTPAETQPAISTGSGAERVPVTHETLRKIWDLIEHDRKLASSQPSGDDDTFIEVPKS